MDLLGRIDRDTIVQEKSLDAAWLRNEVLSHNLANIDTPTYKRKDVDFEKYLRGALYGDMDDVIVKKRFGFRFGKKDGIDSIKPRVMDEYTTMAMRIDGNNVDVDEEMAQMAKNTIRYNVIIQNLNGKFAKMKHAISEGRR